MSKENKGRRQTGGGTIDPDAKADDTSHMVASLCTYVLDPLDNDVDDDAGYDKHGTLHVLFAIYYSSLFTVSSPEYRIAFKGGLY